MYCIRYIIWVIAIKSNFRWIHPFAVSTCSGFKSCFLSRLRAIHLDPVWNWFVYDSVVNSKKGSELQDVLHSSLIKTHQMDNFHVLSGQSSTCVIFHLPCLIRRCQTPPRSFIVLGDMRRLGPIRAINFRWALQGDFPATHLVGGLEHEFYLSIYWE